MLVPVVPGLHDEHHLVYARRLVAGDQVTDLPGGTDRAAQRADAGLQQPHGQRLRAGVNDVAREAVLRAIGAEAPPQVAVADHVGAAAVEVAERVAEEVRAVDAAVDRGRLIGMQHHRQYHRDVRVDRETPRHALLRGDQVVVLGDPVRRVLRLHERE